MERWFGADVDLRVSPTVPRLAPRIDEFTVVPGGDPAEAYARAALIGAFTAPFNVCGYPAGANAVDSRRSRPRWGLDHMMPP